jgi:carboxymethylenebutenolidase
MGGGLALLGPTVSASIGCVASFYPAMPWPDYAPNWATYAGKKALVHKAASDEEWAGPAITSYAAEIAANGGAAEIFEYPGSVHAFFNDARPEVFQQANAELAWQRTVEFFRACGA